MRFDLLEPEGKFSSLNSYFSELHFLFCFNQEILIVLYKPGTRRIPTHTSYLQLDPSIIQLALFFEQKVCSNGVAIEGVRVVTS